MISDRRVRRFRAVLAMTATMAAGAILAAQPSADRYVVPAAIRDAVLNELSGEQAYLHVQMLAGNRNRPASEYQEAFFETTSLRDMARQYGLSDVQVDFFRGGETWDAEEGDLWLIAPVRRKIASLEMVPAALASGSTDADVETEVVYVGAAREADFAGKEVKGKIVLGNTSVGAAFNAAIPRGAVGVLGIGSPGLNANAAGYSLDQIGWASVRTRADRQGFGFALSLRQLTELQRFVERGQKVVMRAHVRSKVYPGKMNVVSATIPGTDPTAGELMLVAHSFETVATPGANDNCTGVGTVMEIGRTLARLVRDGTLPKPKRTIRLLWAPEISGTTAFMFENEELQDKLIAALNFDMTGANPKTTDTYLRMKMTPDSRPSYLNALIGNLLLFADQTEILTQQGANAQFNYRMAHLAAVTSGSDHSVFLAAGIPAMQFNYWPDNFYHSSEDRVARADPTEMKRIGVVAASACYFLANAGTAEARDLAWEAEAAGEKWITEVTRQSLRLLDTDASTLHERHKAAQNKVTWAFQRAKGDVESVLSLSGDTAVSATVRSLVASLETIRDANLQKLDTAYRSRAAALGVKPAQIPLTEAEREASLMVPRRLYKVYSAEAQKQRAQRGGGGRGAQGPPPGGGLAMVRLPGNANSEIAAFIDGTRTVLDIYNAVRAECGHLVVGDEDTKFAYVVSPGAPDVSLSAVVASIQNLEKTGVVTVARLTPKPEPKRKK